MKQELEELVKGIAKTSHGQALKVYLEERRELIKNIDNISSFEELLGRKIAVKYINDIMNFIYTEKKG